MRSWMHDTRAIIELNAVVEWPFTPLKMSRPDETWAHVQFDNSTNLTHTAVMRIVDPENSDGGCVEVVNLPRFPEQNTWIYIRSAHHFPY